MNTHIISARQHRRCRRGSVLVFSLLMMVVAFVVLAFAVDAGYLYLVSTQLQRAADSAALAAASELVNDASLNGDNPAQALADARDAARQLAAHNAVCRTAPELADQDIVIGRLVDPSDLPTGIDPQSTDRFNTAWVRVRRTAEQNGPVQLFFARALGINTGIRQAEATAVFVDNFSGVGLPPSGGNLGMLPITLDKQTWEDLLAGIGEDNWRWSDGEITWGSDGILEANLFPQGANTPGNRGTVDIGNNNNSTRDIARQILQGLTAEDLAPYGGTLQLDENGELLLNGDTGISAGVKDELQAIKGQPRIIPIFRDVSGPGNNAWYTIVGFAGVRIMDVKLTGSMNSKRVIIQPANVMISGGVPNAGDDQTSNFVYSRAWLIH
jgi:hypothetical protein